MRPIPDRAVDFIADFEGCELKAYLDIANVLTIGYGHTGPDVKPGMRITMAQAKELLRSDLAIAGNRIAQRVKASVINELTDTQYSALISFVYNLGANPNWTIWKTLNARNFDQVPSQIIRFNKARVNGELRVVRGLARRRTAEVDLWNEEVSEDIRVGGRDVDTPPVDSTIKPLMQSKTLISGITSAAVGAGAGIIQVQQAIEPHAASNDVLMKVVAGLSIAAAILAAAVVVFKWVDHKNGKN